MAASLIFNPGSASLKFDLIDVTAQQAHAGEGRKLISAAIEEMGDDAKLLVFEGGALARKESCAVHNMTEATRFAVDWIEKQSRSASTMPPDGISFVGIRVVHGGTHLLHAMRVTPEVRAEVERLQSLAPLHNKSSLEILAVVEQDLVDTPVCFAFDTAFHQTLPEVAWRYPIHRETADQFGIRKFGFHGISHRYMLDQYGHLTGKPITQISLVTLHMESGSSATAICHGRSVDNTMGFTPLEGLMMGTRCGSIDPAIIPFLVETGRMSLDEVVQMLNKQSGLLGIAGGTLDTRILAKRDDPAAKLALAMFTYRVRLAVGAYLAALGNADAVIFGGGIGEDSPDIRAEVCAGLANWGLDLDTEANRQAISGQSRISRPGSRLVAYAMGAEEGLQIAHECAAALTS